MPHGFFLFSLSLFSFLVNHHTVLLYLIFFFQSTWKNIKKKIPSVLHKRFMEQGLYKKEKWWHCSLFWFWKLKKKKGGGGEWEEGCGSERGTIKAWGSGPWLLDGGARNRSYLRVTYWRVMKDKVEATSCCCYDHDYHYWWWPPDSGVERETSLACLAKVMDWEIKEDICWLVNAIDTDTRQRESRLQVFVSVEHWREREKGLQ